MKVTFWGVRGSLATPGPEAMRYGGNTSCVAVETSSGQHLVLDAGTGVHRLGRAIPQDVERLDLLLTHLHMDHILGLGFFDPLFRPGLEVHLWGPSSTRSSLEQRLRRYLSPPLFPMLLRDLPCALTLHDVVETPTFVIGDVRVTSELVCHPGPTVGYRVEADGATLTYLPDHEPALGAREFPGHRDWLSGYALAREADLLIHDAQYTAEEYPNYVGWGHSTIEQAIDFASTAAVERLALFHHDPNRTDDDLDALLAALRRDRTLGFQVVAATEGTSFKLEGA